MQSLNSRKVLVTLCGFALAAGIFAFRAQADQWDKKTILTTNQPIQVTDKVLEPGQYVFKLADSSSDRHIVQIFNADQSHIIDTVLAIPNYRLQPTGKSRFTFWETPPGAAKALRAWFYPGDNFGQEFPYPKQLAMLNIAATAPAPQPPPQATPAPEPAPAPAVTEEQPKQEQPTEMAQNTPPPAPAEPQPEPQAQPPAPQPQTPENLPKTGSPYPMIGLGGLLAIALYGVLRLKRMA